MVKITIMILWINYYQIYKKIKHIRFILSSKYKKMDHFYIIIIIIVLTYYVLKQW